jgi:hypothetical protein
MSLLTRPSQATAASTLLEATIAVAIVAVFLSGLYDMNARALSLLKSGLEGVSGTRTLSNTIELVRTATWVQATDPNYIANTILANAPAPGHMANAIETIELNTIPPDAAAKITATRAADGTVTITSPGNGSIPSRIVITADVTITWRTTFNSIQHKRMVSALLSPGGIMGRNQ